MNLFEYINAVREWAADESPRTYARVCDSVRPLWECCDTELDELILQAKLDIGRKVAECQ